MDEILKDPTKYIPLLMQFYLPGYLFFSIYSLTGNEKREDGRYFLEIVVSGLIYGAMVYIFKLDQSLVYPNVFYTSIGAIILAYFLLIITKQLGSLKKRFDFFIGYSSEGILSDIVDMKDGAYIRVTYRDQFNSEQIVISGILHSFDTDKNPKYLSISNYEFQSESKLSSFPYQTIVVPVESLVYIELYTKEKERSTLRQWLLKKNKSN